ncbi:TlpA disulfide reductase family protein [Bradyrhizobium sp.]|uniref:TlpA family protein disulfide reductase n=1 Tax=Bradyrhizobium sp. TaxID=376 RepID=UPI0025C2E9AE|nr:TlpA disulfide reductase family protein [Bradyrhizobium sp.]
MSTCHRSIVSKSYRAVIISLFLVLQVASSSCLAQAPLPQGFEAVGEGTPAPRTKFFDENNLPMSIEAFKGKIVVLNLWATWCAPCIKEMPSLERLAAQMSTGQFAFVAVSQDKGGIAIAKPFLDRLGIRGLAIYTDPVGRLPREYGGRGMPTTFIIGKSGNLISRLEGSADWDAKEIASYLQSLAD